MNLKTVVAALAYECGKADGVKNWAGRNDVTVSYVNMILNGERDPGPTILDALGIECIKTYRRKSGSGK